MDKAEPTLLDGSATTEGKGKGADFDLIDVLRSKDYSCYIAHKGLHFTDEDYLAFWTNDSEKELSMMSRRDRAIFNEKMEQVWAKVDFVASHNCMEAKLRQMREAKSKTHAGHQLGAREFTLTYSPKWFNDEEARILMKNAIQKLIKYYNDDIIQLRAVGEVGSNGLSHVHCFYKLRGGLKISDKNFKRAYKYWNPKKVTSRTGHEGGHHATVRIESDFQGYIDKDVDSAWLDTYFPSPDPA